MNFKRKNLGMDGIMEKVHKHGIMNVIAVKLSIITKAKKRYGLYQKIRLFWKKNLNFY